MMRADGPDMLSLHRRRDLLAAGSAGLGLSLLTPALGGLVLAGAGASGCTLGPGAGRGGAGAGPTDLARLIAACRAAYIYGVPVLEMARARARTIGPQANRLRHVRALADASSRRVTTPNNDTLYSLAWLDLRGGEVELSYPAAGQRYMSLAFLDMYSNNFLVLGPRQTRGEAGRVRLAGPGAPPAPGVVQSPTPWVWFQARTLVASPQDLEAAHRVQDGFAITAAVAPAPPAASADMSARGELAAILDLLSAEAPARPGEARLREGWARAGLTPATLAAASHEVMASVEAGVAQARRDIAARLTQARPFNGWIYPEASLGDFGAEYLYRASIAIWGLGALPVREAAYYRAVDVDGSKSFSPGRDYVLRFPPGGDPPAQAFWSLSLYEVLDDGRLFFSNNPLNRYAIGDRTPGLARAADGSLTIWIGSQDPGPERRTNWLPAPQSPFALILRAYRPARDLITGRYRLPPVSRA